MNQEAQKQTPAGGSPQTEEVRIVSTTYAPLPPPYQIIKWSGSVGMQIGTFIVTVQKPGNMNGLGYHIETHSHPVVAYEDKDRFGDPKKRINGTDEQLYSSRIMEGTVWDYVELKDVTTVCLAGAKLSWNSYIEFLRREMLDAPPGKLPNTTFVYNLELFGVNVDAITVNLTGDFTIWLDHFTTEKWGGRSMIGTRSNGYIVLLADDNQGVEAILSLFAKQLGKWALLFYGRKKLGGNFLDQPFRYATKVDTEEYRAVVNELNRHYGTLHDILERGGYGVLAEKQPKT